MGTNGADGMEILDRYVMPSSSIAEPPGTCRDAPLVGGLRFGPDVFVTVPAGIDGLGNPNDEHRAQRMG